MHLSRDRERTGVIDIGLKSLGCAGFDTLGTGVIPKLLPNRRTTNDITF